MSAIEALTAVLTAEPPGSPGGVRALADSWRHSARAIKEAADLANAARAATTTWTGRSAEAFTTTARTLTRALDTDVDTLGTGARALDLYAQTLDAATATAENLRRRAAHALTTAHTDPTAATATATEITTAWNTLRTTITTAATRTAALLTTTTTNDTADTTGDTANPRTSSDKKTDGPRQPTRKHPCPTTTSSGLLGKRTAVAVGVLRVKELSTTVICCQHCKDIHEARTVLRIYAIASTGTRTRKPSSSLFTTRDSP